MPNNREKSAKSAKSARSPKTAKSRPNPLDRDGITYIDYKDTDLLRRFISDRGKIRSRRVSRVSAQQQRQLARAIKNAREMALLPYSSSAR
uniref:Small ribosomal subunit protein bS18 n=1 Tax=Streptomyces sp. NBC_00003 TaxID=2903608 RepID=A0AAU2V4G5_9ACTN